MPVDAGDTGCRAGRYCPRGASGTGAAAKVDDRNWHGSGCMQRVDDFSHGDEVERSVIKGECGSLPRSIERAMDVLAPAALAPFDIRRRERAQRAGDLLNTKIGCVAAFGRYQPCI
jgi:hypothetical protein